MAASYHMRGCEYRRTGWSAHRASLRELLTSNHELLRVISEQLTQNDLSPNDEQFLWFLSLPNADSHLGQFLCFGRSIRSAYIHIYTDRDLTCPAA